MYNKFGKKGLYRGIEICYHTTTPKWGKDPKGFKAYRPLVWTYILCKIFKRMTNKELGLLSGEEEKKMKDSLIWENRSTIDAMTKNNNKNPWWI